MDRGINRVEEMNVLGVVEENSRPFRCTGLSLANVDTREKWNIFTVRRVNHEI